MKLLDRKRRRKENLLKSVGGENTFSVLYYIRKKKICVSGPAQFKPVLFKGQL